VLGPYELNQIYTGDARELAKQIPDESVDLIFTDPVYDRIDDYRWLAETAARVLKLGGSIVAQCGTHFRYDAETAMRQTTNELWQCPLLCEVLTTGIQQNWKYHSLIAWKPYIWFSKGKHNGDWILDRTFGGGADKYTHIWGDSPPAFINWIERFTQNLSAIVFDPFTGSGTVPAVCKMLGRQYLAFEIDTTTADLARRRVEMTQPPLFVMQPEQIEMGL
jgi:DNA modification methylase